MITCGIIYNNDGTVKYTLQLCAERESKKEAGIYARISLQKAAPTLATR